MFGVKMEPEETIDEALLESTLLEIQRTLKPQERSVSSDDALENLVDELSLQFETLKGGDDSSGDISALPKCGAPTARTGGREGNDGPTSAGKVREQPRQHPLHPARLLSSLAAATRVEDEVGERSRPTVVLQTFIDLFEAWLTGQQENKTTTEDAKDLHRHEQQLAIFRNILSVCAQTEPAPSGSDTFQLEEWMEELHALGDPPDEVVEQLLGLPAIMTPDDNDPASKCPEQDEETELKEDVRCFFSFLKALDVVPEREYTTWLNPQVLMDAVSGRLSEDQLLELITQSISTAEGQTTEPTVPTPETSADVPPCKQM